MSRWRITHVGPTGQRHRLVVLAHTTAAAQAQAVLALGEALALACIRLTPLTPQPQQHD